MEDIMDLHKEIDLARDAVARSQARIVQAYADPAALSLRLSLAVDKRDWAAWVRDEEGILQSWLKRLDALHARVER
jgi:hypothetical protein